ncbi:MAG: hypothetical protein QMD32_03685 [Smithellaceae bacterium]|nr:hypothetical protein [Smithellaceae bacterium]
MGVEHFAAAAAAFSLMTMGFFVIQGCQAREAGWTKVLTPVIPVVYMGALYLVFVLGQR